MIFLLYSENAEMERIMKERIKVYLYNKTIKEIDMSDFSSITEDTFAYHKDIVKVIFPEGVEFIGNNAFENCTRLEEVVCPSTLKSIGKEAFLGCINLSRINYGRDVSIAPNAFKCCLKLAQ